MLPHINWYFCNMLVTAEAGANSASIKPLALRNGIQFACASSVPRISKRTRTTWSYNPLNIMRISFVIIPIVLLSTCRAGKE